MVSAQSVAERSVLSFHAENPVTRRYVSENGKTLTEQFQKVRDIQLQH